MNGEHNDIPIRKWHIWVAMAGVIIAIASVLFRAGSVDANIEARQSRVENDIVSIRSEYARKDVIDQRLLNIEETEKRIELEVKSQNDTLERILQSQRR